MVYVRKVPTASGATAVQIVQKAHGQVVNLTHLGSAHSEAELQALLALAQQHLHGNQLSLLPETRPVVQIYQQQVVSQVLFRSLATAYRQLGFDHLNDDTFANLVIARLTEPTSIRDSIRVLADLGVGHPSNSSLHRCLKRVSTGNYRDKLATLCFAHAATQDSGITLVLYDVTTLYFEIQKEDEDGTDEHGAATLGYRKPGMSKERRLEPQVIVGLLVDQNGFPLELHSFEGNKAETNTILPVVEAFKQRHGLVGITVVADAGMLSADNLEKLSDAGYTYIVGSRLTKIPYDIAQYQNQHDAHGSPQPFADNQIITSTTTIPGQRIIYQYREKRAALDRRNIQKQIDKAEKIVSGKATAKKTKFLSVSTDGKQTKALNRTLIDKATALAGVKGYVTNLPMTEASDARVIAYYHELWHVEQSFRMSKSDLRARPIFHHTKDAIEAHLTLVMAALAVGKTIERKTGLSIKKFVNTLRPLRSGAVVINNITYPTVPTIPDKAAAILRKLGSGD